MLRNTSFIQDTDDDDVILSYYNHINNLPFRNRRRHWRDEVQLSDIKLPTPQGDCSDDDGDTFPATVPMMAIIDFLPKYEESRNDSVRVFEQIEK